MNKQEYLKTLLSEKQILTDKLIYIYNALDDIMFEIEHSKDFSTQEKRKACLLQDSLLRFVGELEKQDYRYHVPIKDLEKENIVYWYDGESFLQN